MDNDKRIHVHVESLVSTKCIHVCILNNYMYTVHAIVFPVPSFQHA